MNVLGEFQLVPITQLSDFSRVGGCFRPPTSRLT